MNPIDVKFRYSKTSDDQNLYHICYVEKLTALCGATLSKPFTLFDITPDDDDICLDCYGAQIDLGDDDPLDVLFMSSRENNINISESDDGETNIDADDFPDLIELQRKHELEHEQKINRGDAASVYNKQKDDTDTRRTDILIRSLQIKINKKKRILKRTDISSLQRAETQRSLHNAVAAKTTAESEMFRRDNNRPKKARSVKIIPARTPIVIPDTKKKSQPSPLKKVTRVKKIRGVQPAIVVPPHPGYKPNLTTAQKISTHATTPQYGNNVRHVVNKSSCKATWVNQGQPDSKVYEYSLNSGRKRAIDRMRREYPLSPASALSSATSASKMP